MPDLTSPGGDLEPIERASADELRALQFERLRWTLRHAYANVPHYRAAFDEAGRAPGRLRELADLAKFPFTTKDDLRETTRSACSPCRSARWSASTPAPAPRAGPPWSATPRDDIADLGQADGPLASAPPAAARATMVHNAYGYGLFTGGLGAHYGAESLGCTVIPVSGGMTERQVTLIQDFRPDVIMVTPSYMLTIARRDGAPGHRPGRRPRCRFGDPRRRAVDRARCGTRSRRAWTSTPATSTACPR